ncbi:MAG: MBL fold metallo-hydrolase [Candidatus Wildermuthbacteria bacterium]|nr:MBL fold metallo-hydrolase [Candidatus Wildermuthbacteria bacterium]
MQIIWKGQACFSVIAQRNKQEQVKLVIDPFDPSIGLKMPVLEADIVLSTHDHEDHNNVKAVKGTPFVITGPGEYEIKDVSVRGIPSFHDEKEGKERGKNTIYVIEAEGMRLCHLGDLGQGELTEDQVSRIGNVDILLIPVGGVYTIGAKAAAKIVSQIEPRIVIPMHYMLANLRFKLEKVDEFLKEMGVKNAEAQPKLVIKLRDFTSEETKVMVLQP